MAKFPYTKGLHDLGNGCFAYLQPAGSWGWSNAGLVVDGAATLLVDTLFDLPLTRACDLMLSFDVETVVPGHGPITDKAGIRAVKGYFEYVLAEARERYDAGLDAQKRRCDMRIGRAS